MNRFTKIVFALALFFLSQLTYSQRYTGNWTDFILENKDELNLNSADLSELEVYDEYVSASMKLTNVFVQQKFQGVDILGAVMGLHFKEDGEIFHYSEGFHAGLAAKVTATSPAVGHKDALSAALQNLQITTDGALQIKSVMQGAEQKVIFDKGDFAVEDIPVRLVFFPLDDDKLVLAWQMEIYLLGRTKKWNVLVDANTLEVLRVKNDVIECRFSKLDGRNKYACNDQTHTHTALSPQPKLESISGAEKAMAPNSYQVYAEPLESPNHGPRTVEVDPADPIASPFGWHDDNGVPGAEYTITRGNNVWAMDDTDANDDIGYSPDGGPTLEFIFPIDLTQQPITYLDASITNLFYWNNYIHDLCYNYGMDENAGAFQAMNYGGPAAGQNDFVYADAQDGGGLNNANFQAPVDGTNGIMQMYLWAAPPSDLFFANAPASVAGIYDATEAAFGPALDPTPITANVVLADDGSANPNEACNAFVNGAAINGNIAMVDRGSCTFVVKVKNAQNEGAVACIVCNNVPGAPIPLGGADPTITIPSVMISQADCDLLKSELGPGLNVTLVSNSVNLDGDLDNGIVAHEYGHGVSIRLTGGPNNSGCLNNDEQMGEGWSDFIALMTTMRPGDNAAQARGIGTYAIGEGTGGTGIRPTPYSTDMAINPSTYQDINFEAVPHGVGYVWCSMLWELNWLFINQYGWDPDLMNGTGGNNIAFQLVMDGMQLQGCSPGFETGRDAILTADQNRYGGLHQCLIWNAFAKRGMGFSASEQSRFSRADGTEAFDLPPGCSILLPVEFVNVGAEAKERHIDVSWEVAFENVNKGYELHRREFGLDQFEKVAEVGATNPNNGKASYTYSDATVKPNRVYFYKIRQIDTDGSEKWSPVVSAWIEDYERMIAIYPNPVKSALFVNFLGDFKVEGTFTLMNSIGVEVLQTRIDPYASSFPLELNVSHLANGVYVANFKSGEIVITRKIVIQQ